MNNTKHCPFCDELISINAKKCRFCGEWLEEKNEPHLSNTTIIEVFSTKYEILEEIGRGGMATVYKAKQKNLNRIVALKVVPKEFTHDTEFVARFQREAQSAAKLNHNNIITIHDVGEIGGYPYIAMEYLAGGDLHQKIQKEGVLSEKETKKIILPIIDALGYAHYMGIIHRDIKSSNIMLGKKGRPVLMDFGIAKSTEGTKLTKTGTIIGTPEYMSPEQASGSSDVDNRSDIYSLGIVMYEMATGRVPFLADTALGVLSRVVNDYPTNPKDLNAKLTDGLVNILLKSISKQPDDRFQSCDEFAESIKTGKVEFKEPEKQENLHLEEIEQERKERGEREKINENELSSKTTAISQPNKKTEKLKVNKILTGTEIAVYWLGLSAFSILLFGLLFHKLRWELFGISYETSGFILGILLSIISWLILMIKRRKILTGTEISVYWLGLSAFSILLFGASFYELGWELFGLSYKTSGFILGILLSIISGLILMIKRRKILTGTEIAVYWFGLSAFSILLFGYLFDRLGYKSSGFILGILLSIISWLILMIKRRKILTGTEISVYWLGLSAFSILLFGASFYELGWELFGLSYKTSGFILGILLSIISGLILMIKRRKILTGTEIAVYWFGLSAFSILLFGYLFDRLGYKSSGFILGILLSIISGIILLTKKIIGAIRKRKSKKNINNQEN